MKTPFVSLGLRAAAFAGVGLVATSAPIWAQNTPFSYRAAAPRPAQVPLAATNYSVPTPVAGSLAVIYVSPNGATTGSGSTAGAPVSLDRAVAIMKADTNAAVRYVVVFRGGTYYDPPALVFGTETGKGQIDHPFTLQAYAGEKPWLVGAQIVTAWTSTTVNGSARWWMNAQPSGSNFLFPPSADSNVVDPASNPWADDREMIFVNGEPLVQVGFEKLNTLAANQFCVDRTNKRIYIAQSPSNKTLEVTSVGTGILMNKPDSAIKGIGLRGFAVASIEANSAGSLVERCTITWNGKMGVGMWGNNQILRANRITSNGQTGCFVGRGTPIGTLVEANRIDYNNVEKYNRSWAAAGLKVNWLTNGTFRDNWFDNNDCYGLWIDSDADGNLIYRNVATNNINSGIFYEISGSGTIAFNLVAGNSFTGIYGSDAQNVRVYNNTLVNNKDNGLRLKGDGRINHPNGGPPIGSNSMIGAVVKNNIFSEVQGSKGTAQDSRHPTFINAVDNYGDNWGRLPSANMFSALDHNVYYRNDSISTAHAINWRNTSTAPQPPNSTAIYAKLADGSYALIGGSYAGFGGFRSNVSTTYEANGIFNLDGQSPHPLFTTNASSGDYSSGDFRPSSAAPQGVRSGGDGGVINGAVYTSITAGFSNPWPGSAAVKAALGAQPDAGSTYRGAFKPITGTTVTLTSPASGATFTGSPTTSVSLSATAVGGTISRVDFLANGQVVASDTTSPYNGTWSNAPAGNHHLQARAVLSSGAAFNSAAVPITVKAQLGPIADAYVRDGTGSDTNFGTETLLKVKKDAVNYNREGYLKFDIDSVPASAVGAATLRLWVANNSSDTLSATAYRVDANLSTGASWTDTNLTWNNRPTTNFSTLASFSVATISAGKWVELDVTSAVSALRDGGFRFFAVRLVSSTLSSGLLDINSKENTSYKPQLVIAP